MVPHKLRIGVTISTTLEESKNIDDIYRGVKLYIEGLGLNVDFAPVWHCGAICDCQIAPQSSVWL